MTREEFINVLKEHDIPFEDLSNNDIYVDGYDGVYVFSRKEYSLKKKHPRKYKNLYIPYIRVSNFGGEWYTRQDGWCCYMPEEKVIDIVLKEMAS